MKHLLIFTFLITLLTTTSCKKWQHQYPEDTERTKLTPTERLTDKSWTLVSTTLNGQDYNDTIQQQFGKYKIQFGRNIAYPSYGKSVEHYTGNIETDLELGFATIWSFHDQNSITIIPFNGNNSNQISIIPCYLRDLSYTYLTYNILKLSDSEFKISIQNKNRDSTIINYFKTL